MKIQIKKQEDEELEGFKRGDLLESNGGIYLCLTNEVHNYINLAVISPESEVELPGEFLYNYYAGNFKLFTGEITLSND
jgi:hypothetical protein